MNNIENKISQNRRKPIVPLPIKGGVGISMNDAIIINNDAGNDYKALESLIIDLMGISMGIKMEAKGQYHTNQNGRYYDVHSVVTSSMEDTTETEIYFDVTECV